MRLTPVLVGFLVGALFCGCAGLCSGVVTSAEDIEALTSGAYMSSYDQGHAVGGLLAGPCCVGLAGGLLGALVGLLAGRAKPAEE